MISEAVLSRAVDEGILSAEQALKLSTLALEDAGGGVPRLDPTDPERLRFVSGFGDVFVTLGLALFLGALAYLVNEASGQVTTAIVVAIGSWSLAEYFTRRRHMALPSITLVLVFNAAVFIAISGAIASGHAQLAPAFGFLGRWGWIGRGDPSGTALAGLATAALMGAYFARFRVSVGIALIVCDAAASILLALYAAAPAFTLAWIDLLLFVWGIAAFGLAMRFDLSDPSRSTRRGDIAFWLHFVAAPLLVHSVYAGLVHVSPQVDIGRALLILLIFVPLGLVALLVDRRALLVSGLSYAGYAIASLIRQTGLGERTITVTLLVVGAIVLLLSAGWRPLRGLILARLPGTLSARLPHPALT